MAEQIQLETIALGQMLLMVISAQSEIDSIQKKVVSARDNLHWRVNEKNEINEQLIKIVKEENVLKENLINMENALKSAIVRSDEFNEDFGKKAAGILTAIIATASAIFSGGNSGTINSLMKIRDWISGVEKPQNTWSATGAELLKEIEERDGRFMNNPDGTQNLSPVGPNNNWAARNASDGKVNCKWLTQQKIKYLTGTTMDMEQLGRAAQSGGFDSSKGYFRVMDIKAGKSSVKEILNSIDQPAENIVLTWSVRHSMMIDKIENGMVYCSDNFTEDWKKYLNTKVLPAKQYTLEEFINKYQSLAGTPSHAYQIAQ